MILSVGDAGLDLTLVVNHSPESDEKVHARRSHTHAGGVAANFAAAAVKLGSPTSLCARVGTDAFGDLVVEDLSEAGIGLDLVARDETIKTYYSVSIVDQTGEKRLVLYETPGLYPSVEQLPQPIPAGTSWCHTVPYDPQTAGRLAEMAQDACVPLSIDLEPAALTPELGELISVLSRAETLIMNRRTAERLEDDPRRAAELVGRLGARVVIVTLGAAGVLLFWKGRFEEVPSFLVEVADSTGAGDVFAAAYVHRLLRGAQPPEAVWFASAAGALACQGLGAQGALPNEDAVLELLGSRDD